MLPFTGIVDEPTKKDFEDALDLLLFDFDDMEVKMVKYLKKKVCFVRYILHCSFHFSTMSMVSSFESEAASAWDE